MNVAMLTLRRARAWELLREPPDFVAPDSWSSHSNFVMEIRLTMLPRLKGDPGSYVQDVCRQATLKQRLLTHRLAYQQHFRRGCWLMHKAVKCMREGDRHHSEHLLNYLGIYRHIAYITGRFQSHQQSTEQDGVSRYFIRCNIKGREVKQKWRCFVDKLSVCFAFKPHWCSLCRKPVPVM